MFLTLDGKARSVWTPFQTPNRIPDIPQWLWVTGRDSDLQEPLSVSLDGECSHCVWAIMWDYTGSWRTLQLCHSQELQSVLVHAGCHGVPWKRGPWVCCSVVHAGCHGVLWERGPWVCWWFLINLTQAWEEKNLFLIFFPIWSQFLLPVHPLTLAVHLLLLLSIQKRTGLPWISARDGITSCRKTRHLLSY